MSSRNTLRKNIGTQRRLLSKPFVEFASKQIVAKLLDLPELKNAHHIAGYFANNNEADPMPICETLLAQQKSYYLPTLDLNQKNHLVFAYYRPGDTLILNRYKIPEPHVLENNICPAQSLDIVLMPLVAFDKQGGRLGMGAGYYDRTFAFTKESVSHKPLLIGLAYEFQCVDQLDCEEWDVPLDRVVTEKGLYVMV